MLKKYISRKFLLPIFYALLVVGNQKYSIGLNDTELISIAGTISAFIVGESYIDVNRQKE